MTSVALALSTLLHLVSDLASGAGRKPYGGAVDMVVTDAGAVLDPHLAADRSARLLATLVHGRLYRPVAQLDGSIEIVPELAGSGGGSDGTWTITLADGARCHDGQLLTPGDVVQSWARLQQVSPLRTLASLVKVSEAGPRAVTFTYPRAMPSGELLSLLARPEAAMLRGGRAASNAGCGAYRPTSITPDAGGKLVLEAFAGHAEGRPWIDRVVVKVDAKAQIATAFRYGESDVGWEPVAGRPASAVALGSGWASFYAVPRPGLRGPDRLDLRRRVSALAAEARLQRYVEGRGANATTPWPDALAPTSVRPVAPASMQSLTGMVIAYPDGDDELAELARALRDALRPVTSDNARVVAVARLTLSSAASERDPLWDLAVVRHTWTSLTRDQALFELADALAGVVGGVFSASDVYSANGRRWADGLAGRLELVSLVHVARGPLIAAGLRGVGAASAVPGLVDGYRVPRGAP